jgi:enoyl-CoA hydratase/carnithine racemase
MGVDVELHGAAAVVTLRWTDRRNALGPYEARAVAEAITEAGTLGRVVVLTGEGSFCAGGDLKAFGEISARLTPPEIRTHVYGDVQAMVRALRDVTVPTIAAVDGAAVGLGMDLALACDSRFIGPKGFLQQGWGRAGLISATGGTWFLEQAGPGSLWALLADQPRLDGDACVARGLADPADGSTALDAAVERATHLAVVPADTLAAYAVLSRKQRWPSDDYFDLCADYQSEFIGSDRFRDLTARMLAATS